MSVPLEIVLVGLEEQILEIGQPICECAETFNGREVGRKLAEDFGGLSLSQSVMDSWRPRCAFEVLGIEAIDVSEDFSVQLLLDRCDGSLDRVRPFEHR